jgi:hypothetical protein
VEADPEGAKDANAIAITASEVRFDGEILAGAELRDDLARQVVRVKRLGAVYHRDDEPRVVLGITPDAQWGKVVEVWNDLQRAGFGRAGFFFERPHPMQDPGWSWRYFQIMLAARSYWANPEQVYPPRRDPLYLPVELSQRANLLSTVAACPELTRRVEGMSHRDFVASLGSFADECRCAVDTPSLRAILWAIHPADPSTVRVIGIPATDEASDAVVIDASPDALWSEVAPRIASLPRGASAVLRAVR